MKRVFVIAEAGVNHNGRLDLALQMIDVAADCGADAVKFQTFKSHKEISKHAEKAQYQKETTDAGESLLDMAIKLELDEDAHRTLLAHANRKGVKFMSSPFEGESIEFLNSLGLDVLKIPSGQVDNLPYLRQIGALHKTLILSTGMSTLEEVETAINVLVKSGTRKEDITVLQCTTAYPTPIEDVNLTAMLTMRDRLLVNVGYSDHTLGIEMAIAAAAMGAQIIEKHFTLDKLMIGPDHRASLEPMELKAMTAAIRRIEAALGDGIKRSLPSEEINRPIARRSIVAARPIKRGEVFTAAAITTKSPATGLSPMVWDTVIGAVAKRDFDEDELIQL